MIRLAAVPVVVASFLVAAPAAAEEEPIITAGGSTPIIAVADDGGVVVFDSATRNIDPLVRAREPQGTYLWTSSTLGRVEQIGSNALDITGDGRTAVHAERRSGFEGAHLQAWVFSVERNTGREVVSVSTGGEEANADVCCGVSISDDGRHVAFSTTATNLGGGSGGVFVRDRVERTTTRVAATGPNGGFPVLSDDASTIVYTDELTVYVRDLPDGEPAVLTASGASPDVDADGDVVAFTRYDREAETEEVVVLDRTTGVEVRIPDAFQPSLSDDGRRVAYVLMEHLGTADQTLPQVYVRDLTTGETTLASRTPSGAEGHPGSISPQLSGDGRKVVFESAAVDLIPDQVDAPGNDLYVADVDTGAITLLTVGRDAGLHQLRTDGFVNSYGAAQPRTPQPRLDGAVAIATPAFRDGFWVTNAAGRVARAGHAQALGEITTPLARPVVGMASSRSGHGYWLVASDGGVFSFGDAAFFGSTGALRLNQPIVGLVPTPSAQGYWLVAADGGIFSFGDAAFLGSTGAMRLNRPIVGMARTPTGRGYWLVASDGGIFSFGDAAFHGSTGAIALNQPIVAMVRTHTGRGYRLVAADGGVFAFGDASHLWGPSDPRCCIVDAAGA